MRAWRRWRPSRPSPIHLGRCRHKSARSCAVPFRPRLPLRRHRLNCVGLALHTFKKNSHPKVAVWIPVAQIAAAGVGAAGKAGDGSIELLTKPTSMVMQFRPQLSPCNDSAGTNPRRGIARNPIGGLRRAPGPLDCSMSRRDRRSPQRCPTGHAQ